MKHDYDLIIRNGLLIDGSGAAARPADVAVRNGCIASLERSPTATADTVIDAEGRYVTPGFVDVHTHYDGQATWDDRLQPSSNLGATTVVMGNCGVGFAPCRERDREVLVQLMEGVEEIPGTAMYEGLKWDWESFPDFLEVLDSRPHDIDVAALLPHGPLRVFVMGERGVNREAATAEDIAAMQQLVREGLDAGAVGLSTSRTLVHRTSTGDLIPTFAAARDELTQLTSVMEGEKGHVFQFISDFEDADAEFEMLRETSRATGATGTFTLLDLEQTDADGAPVWQRQLERLEQAQADGLKIQGQVISRPVGILMGHSASMSPFYKRPSFAEIEDLPLAEKVEALRDPARKARILAEGNIQPHIFVRIFEARFERMFPFGDTVEYLPERNTSVADQAAAEGREPAEWLYDFLLGNDGTNLIYIPAANFSEHIPDLLKHPCTVPALGDGGAHVGSICDTSANLYLITRWVQNKRLFTLEEAIHLLTRKPAELYSLLDRGLVAEGMVADLNILDVDALRLHRPHVVHDLPAGGSRFLQRADGLVATIKSGVVLYQEGEHTGALPGRLLRGAQADPRVAAAG
ncbi:MAG: amidohydrolase family protein [Pseudomonadota bacterium]